MRVWQERKASRTTAMLLATATGVLFALAQAPVGFWLFAFVWLVPLLCSLAGRGRAARAALGGLAGAVAATACAVGPAAAGASAYFDRPLWQGLLFITLVGQFYGGGGFALFALLAGDPLRQRTSVWIVRVGAAFSAAELARSEAFTGLPWLLLPHALAPAPVLAQLAAFGGILLLAFWLASANAALLGLATQGRRRVAALVMLTVIGAAIMTGRSMPEAGRGSTDAPAAPGAVRRAEGVAPPPGAIRVALVQPAGPDSWRGDPLRARDRVDHLIEVSRKAGQVDLVVWPENAVHVLLPANERLVDRAVKEIGSRSGLLLGAPRFDPADPGHFFNAALLFDSAGRAIAAHDKVHLLPFTEYVPWPLAGLGIGTGGSSAGAGPVALPLDGTLLGPLICFEILFPEIARSLVAEGAGVLFNLSNDAWFAGTGGAEQHFAGAVILAIAMRRPVLRSTPTGVTAAIDAAGRVIGRLPADEPGALVVDVWPGENLTVYGRVGDAFAWAALAVTSLLTIRRGGS